VHVDDCPAASLCSVNMGWRNRNFYTVVGPSGDQLQTALLDREETIRSKTREGVEQELWRILLAYNLVRLEMARVAKSAKVEPTRISFVESLRLIRDEWVWSRRCVCKRSMSGSRRMRRRSPGAHAARQRADEVAVRAERFGVGARKRRGASLARPRALRHRRQ